MRNKVVLLRSRATDSCAFKIAETLSERYEVILIVWNRSLEKIEIKSNYKLFLFNLKAPYDNIKVLMFIPLWLVYQYIMLIRIKPDIVHSFDIDTLLPAIFYKIIKSKKLVYTILDFYADTLVYAPKFIKNILSLLEKSLLRFCDAVIIVDPSRYSQIKGAPIRELGIIYNTPPDIVGKNEFFIGLQKTNSMEFVIFYAGNLHRERNLIRIIKAILTLDNTRFIIAGRGELENIIVKIAEKFRNKITYLGFITYDEVLKKGLSADALVAFYDPNIPNNLHASPNKLFEAMMLAKPIITNDGTLVAKFVKRFGIGLVVPYDDIAAIKKAFLLLRDNPNLVYLLGNNGRKLYEKFFSWNKMRERLFNIYKSLLTES
ncbi:MAG: glycosyltransferase family 4 protein [Desulfurococcaceae archaeon]